MQLKRYLLLFMIVCLASVMGCATTYDLRSVQEKLDLDIQSLKEENASICKNIEKVNEATANLTKMLADIKKDIYDEDLEAILYEEVYRVEDKYNLVYLNVVSGNVAIPTATMEMQVGKDLVREAGFGNGPVDATFAAIRAITKTNYPLMKYAVNAITGGSDAQGEVTVQLKYNGHSVAGRGAHPDVIVASAKAYINALNRLEFLKENAKKVRVE